MSVNSFAFPNYILPPLKELVDKEAIGTTVMIYSNPPRLIVTLERDIDLRWRISRAGTDVLIFLSNGHWHDEDLLIAPGDDRDQIDDQLTINSNRMPEWENLRLAMVKWKYDGINPVQGQ